MVFEPMGEIPEPIVNVREAAKEIARLRGIANNRICAVCLERHDIDVMCPPVEVRTTGQAWFRAELAARNERIEELARANGLLRDALVMIGAAAHLRKLSGIEELAERVLKPETEKDDERTVC